MKNKKQKELLKKYYPKLYELYLYYRNKVGKEYTIKKFKKEFGIKNWNH